MPLTHRLLACVIALSSCARAVTAASAADIAASRPSRGVEDLTLRGHVVGDDAARLEAVLAEAASRGAAVRRIHLDSPGGTAQGGLLLARVILRHGLDTDVPAHGLCASACFLVFASGRRRTAGEGAVLGVHGSAEDGEANDRTALVDAALAKVLSDLRVPDQVTRRMLSTPPDDVYVLTPSDLRAMGVSRPGAAGRR